MTRRLVALLLIALCSFGGLAAAWYSGMRPALGLDLQGGISVILGAPSDSTRDQMDQVVEVLRRRIEGSGVQEPEISVQGETQILVQLPGVTDTDAALEIVGQTGQLSFRPVLAADYLTNVEVSTDDDPDVEGWMPSSSEPDIAYLVGTTTLLGTDLSEAVATPGPTGAYVVNLTFSNEGAQKFADLTAQAASFPSGDARRQIAIVLDGAVISAPPVAFDVSPSTGIAGGQAVVTLGSGPDSRQEAEDLAIVLRYGALPVELERMSLQQVSATLGQDALRAGIVAGTVGVILVAILVITIYRALGVIAIGGLLIFGAFILLSFILLGEWMGVTLTLAGVTGMIVSVGMNADSYIIYFERTKELVREGATPSAAAAGAFKSAYRTILTATFVSFMGAFLLWLLAIGPVKGFAFSLGIATIIGVIVVRWYAVPAVAMLAESRLGTSGFLSIPAVSGAVAEEVTT